MTAPLSTEVKLDLGDVASFDLEEILAQASAENFPVALRVLSSRDRELLNSIYGFARFVDDVGDRYEGDRTAALDWVAAELERACRGEQAHPVFTRGAAFVETVGAGTTEFGDLISANRLDQDKATYETFEELEQYCALSANPVGRLVLLAFGNDGALAAGLSDRICTALQVIEHLQDIGEDRRAGRVYLPVEDARRFGVVDADLDSPVASSALRRLVAYECGRARRLLRDGLPLLGLVAGTHRVALAGFVGGGLAQLDAIERRGFDTLSGLVKATKLAIALASIRVLGAAREFTT